MNYSDGNIVVIRLVQAPDPIFAGQKEIQLQSYGINVDTEWLKEMLRSNYGDRVGITVLQFDADQYQLILDTETGDFMSITTKTAENSLNIGVLRHRKPKLIRELVPEEWEWGLIGDNTLAAWNWAHEVERETGIHHQEALRFVTVEVMPRGIR